jgi:acetoin utilization deacetylase AcuC-like enzyme
MAKYRLLRDRICGSPLMRHCELHLAPPATNEQLQRAHTQEYVRRVATGQLSDVELRRLGFPWSEQLVERAKRSVGATIAAGECALRDGFSANLAGGTHHAFADRGQGYCVFNDCCVAARNLQHGGLVRDIAIVDLDVHQGNGTASIAAGDSSIVTLSIHCSDNFPFHKTAGTLDVELPPGTTDAEYLSELHTALVGAFSTARPDIVFYVSGADPFEGDRFGKLKLTKAGLMERDRIVYEFFARRRIPVAATMAGGYARNIDDLVDIHFGTIQVGVNVYRNIRWGCETTESRMGGTSR